MASVVDRWHKARAKPDEVGCPASCGKDKVASAEHGRGKRWLVRWRDDRGEQRKHTFDKKAAADSFAAEVKHDLDRGTSVDLAAGRTKVQDYAAKWRAGLLHRDSTVERMDRVFRLHVDPILGHLPVGQVRPSNIRSWVKDRSDALAPSTLAVVYSNLASMFAAAVLDRAIGVSPCTGVRLPERDRHEHYIPTPDQVHELAVSLDARYSAIAYVAAGCGLRGGEVMGLELDSIDFLRREVDVRQQLVCVTGRAPYLAPPKTKTSARTVELPEVTSTALARHLEQYPPVEVVIDDETDPRNPTRRTARLIFTRRAAPIHRATWSHIWRPAAKKAGIPKGIGLHALRHYFATLLIHNGASVKTVQLALGHSTPTITLDTYVGEWPEAHEKTRTLVDAALGSVPRMCPVEAVKA